MSPIDVEARHAALLEHPVVVGLSPATRALYLSLYSPRQWPRRYYPIDALKARAASRGVPDPRAALRELVQAELALYHPLLEDLCFLHPDEADILTIPW